MASAWEEGSISYCQYRDTLLLIKKKKCRDTVPLQPETSRLYWDNNHGNNDYTELCIYQTKKDMEIWILLAEKAETNMKCINQI